MDNKSTLIWLNSLNLSNRNIEKIMNQIPQLSNIWHMPTKNIYNLEGIKTNIKEKIVSNRKEEYVNKLLMDLSEHNINTTTVFDDDYPKSLYNIYDNPKILYRKGHFKYEDQLSIAIVGSRKATSYGIWATEKFVRELVKLDITIISGLAQGIDYIAHRTALEEDGRTIGVLGNGLDIIYPKKNKDVYEEIPKNGAIVSEYFLGTPPLAYNFPQRNRIISGLSLGVIIIEAKEKSGSLITAHHALEQGKEVFALPGNINSVYSRGTNKLIRDGAKLIMDIDDILEEIYELQSKMIDKKIEDKDISHLSPLELKVFETIKESPIHCDNIAYNTGLDISTVYSILTILELKGMVKELSGRIFTVL